MVTMRYRMLGETDLFVSQIGFGASPLGDVFGATDPAESTRAVRQAVASGINFFDVSPYYGRTLAEKRLGNALIGIRKNIILSTKCGRYGFDSFDFSASRIKRSIDESLTRLQTDYVDLFMAHDIEFGSLDQIVGETLPALQEVQKSGKARYIGITGYPLAILKAATESQRVDAILSYCHYNLLITDLEDDLEPFAKAQRIGLINASPLHMGLLTEAEVPVWHPAPAGVRSAAKQVVELCRAREVDPAVMALGFSIGQPYVASTLVGMSNSEQVETNLRALDFELDPVLLLELQQIVAPVKDVVWASGLSQTFDVKSCPER